MIIEPENLNRTEAEIIRIQLLDYLCRHIFVESKHLTIERKFSRFLAAQLKINLAFEASD